jgi:cyanate lyase
MSIPIGSLNYQIAMDASQLNASATLTRQQMRDVRRVLQETKDPAQVLQEQLDRLKSIFEAGAITAEQYEKAVANVHARSPAGIERAAQAERELAEAKKRAAAAEAEKARMMSRGEAITRSVMTGEERHIAHLRELRQLLDQNAISQEHYNRAVERSRRENLFGRSGPGAALRNAATNLTSSMPGVSDAVSTFALSGGGVAAMGLAAGLGAVVAAGAGVIHVSNQVRQMTQHIDEAVKVADKLGMSFNELNTIRLALAESSGLDAASVDNALQKMMLGINAAAVDQSGAVYDTLSALGLQAGELLKAGPLAALEQIMDATQGLKDPTDQLAVAYDLFGRQGASLVLSLRAGKESLRDMQAWLEQTGNSLTAAQTEGIQIANDQWARMQLIAQGLYTQLSAELAPVFQVIAETIMAGSGEFSAMKDYIRPVVDAAAYFAGVLYDAWEMSQLLQTTLRNIVTLNWSGVGEGIQSALDFGTGARNVAALEAARQQAEESARAKEEAKTNEESQLAAIERQREAEKAAAAERLALEKSLADERAKQIKERERLEAEAERQAQQARERDAAAVDALYSKYVKHYALQKEIAKLDDLRQKGLISQEDHARWRGDMLEKEARQDVQRAQSQTITKGSVEEYNAFKSAENDKIDAQMLEIRKQTLAIELMRSELVLARKHIEKIKQPRTYR